MAAKHRKRTRDAAAEDALTAWAFGALDWARKNQRSLILLVIGLVVLIGGVLYYLDYQARVSDLAAGELRGLRSQVRTQGGQGVIQNLESFIAQFGGTPYADEARVLLAEQLLWQGRAQEAIGPAREVAGDLGREPLGTRAAFLLAAAHEEAGDTMAAIEAYERIGARAELDGDRTSGLQAAARLRAASGDVAGAIAVYDRLLGMVPEESTQYTVYRMRRAELQAQVEGVRLGNGSG